jgi:peroxiredoxin/mono/diheme cytochrome c family protein
MRCLSSLIGLALVLALLVSAAPGQQTSVGRKVDNFTLADYRGKQHSLADYADCRAVVIAFVGAECPLAKLYGPRLAELAGEFEPRGVAMLAIDANRQDSMAEIAAYARLHGIKFPVLRDENNKVADALGATRTPEVFLLDAQRVVRYQGRIDDQYGLTIGSNYAKPKLTHSDLVDALNELLSGKEVSHPHQPATGCLIGRIRQPNEKSQVTYSNQIARIFQNHCVECHRQGEIAPFALTSYEEAQGWAEMIEEVVRESRMPPWHADPRYGKFSNDRRLSDQEREQIFAWVHNGAPEGDPSDLPPPRQFVQGWGIPEPDMVVYMSDTPYTVPAEGVVEYEYFTVDPGFAEDKWIKASECRPGNRSVVHHIFVFVQPPGAADQLMAGAGQDPVEARKRRKAARDLGEIDFSQRASGVRLISGTAPGVPPFVNPAGMAFYVPKGSKLVFQMHYTPNGSEQQDRSCVGLCFARPEEVKAALDMDMAINFAFQIPAGADNHQVESWREFDRDTMVLSLVPHMHLRGKSFRYEIIYADGRAETILDVPRYDFNWQLSYNLAEPLLVPAGSKMHCIAHFDNSENNLANPDPTKPVRWGDQTWEEMMIGWFAKTTDLDYDSLPADQRRTAQFLKAAAAGKVEVTKRITRAAAKALESEKAFDTLHRLVTTLCPQVDRVDVSAVDEGTLRFRAVSQPPIVKSKVGGSEVEISGAALALEDYAGAKSPTVQNQLDADDPHADLAHMARGLRSSLHVPVTIDGQACCVNFWSREREAFPSEAVEVLTQVAQLIGK